jgi:hypothetical protein
MATAAQIAANQTNAVTFGLFTHRDFVLPNENEEYAALSSALRAELNPQGTLEETFATAILGATWRLRRCAAVEARMALAANEADALDPMEADEPTRRLQISIDRSRAQAHNLLRRSLTELRRLQTQRNIRVELFDDAPTPPAPDLTNYDEVLAALDRGDRARLRLKQQARMEIVDAIMAPMPHANPRKSPEPLDSFCNEPIPEPAARPSSTRPPENPPAAALLS